MSDSPAEKLNQKGPPTLRRALGLPMALAVVVGNVIGSGVFLKPGTIAADGGSFGLIIAVWILGGLLCVLGALCFAELATMLPRAGGLYVYIREAYGRPLAFLFGWSEFLFTRPAGIAALAVAFVTTFGNSLGLGGTGEGGDPLGFYNVLFAAGLIAVLAWVNIMGVLWGGTVQLVSTVVKGGGLLIVAAMPFVLIPFITHGFDAGNYATTSAPSDPSFFGRVALVLLAVMWAYNGWHGVTPLAEEVKHPQRNIPLALFGGIGILIVLYLAANFAYHSVLTMDQMGAAGEGASKEMMRSLLKQPGVALITGIIMCSTFGAINTNLLHSPRVTFAMGRDGVFFRGLGHVHAEYRTPAAAIFVTATMAVLLIVVLAVAKYSVRDLDVDKLFAGKSAVVANEQQADGDQYASTKKEPLPKTILVNLKQGTMFGLLTDFVIFAASIFYTLAVLAVIILRRRCPEMERPYRTWGYPVVPCVFIAVYCWFLWRIYLDKPLISLAGLFLIALGLPVFYAYRHWSRGQEAE